jgi:hypothetical protein
MASMAQIQASASRVSSASVNAVDSYLESACTRSLDHGHQFVSHGAAAAAVVAAPRIEEFGASSLFERPLMSGFVVVAISCGY